MIRRGEIITATMPKYSDTVVQFIHRLEENEELTAAGGKEVLMEVEHAKLNIVVDSYSSTHAKRISAVEKSDLYELQESYAQRSVSETYFGPCSIIEKGVASSEGSILVQFQRPAVLDECK